MKKVVSLFVIIVMLVGIFAMPTFAADGEYQPAKEQTNLAELDTYYPILDWSHTQSIMHGVSFSGNTANAVCSYTAYSASSRVDVSLTLQKMSGSSWINVKTWTGSDTFNCFISEYVTVSSGTYRTKTVGKVYPTGSSRPETVTVYSSSKVK